MGELGQAIEIIKTPIGILGVVALAVFFVSRSNSSLSFVLQKVVPTLLGAIDNLRDVIKQQGKAIKANTDEHIKTRSDMDKVRADISGLHSKMDQFQIALSHSDERHASLITHVTSLTAALERFLTRAKTEANRLNEVPIGDGTHTKLKKAGNDPGDNQGR